MQPIHHIRTFFAAGLLAAASLVTATAQAGTINWSGSWDTATKTMVPNIPTPAGTLGTTFTTYSNNYNYALRTFTVDTSGVYTATVTTTNVTNTSWFLTGTFAPSPSPTQPTTPIGNFFAGLFAGVAAPYTDSYTSLNLVAGQQYSMLIAFNTGGAINTDTFTATLSGPGCISSGSTTCSAASSVPTLSEWSLAGVTTMIALMAFVAIRRRRL